MSKQESRRDHFISRKLDRFFSDVYSVARFIGRFFNQAFRRPFEFNEIIKQCYEIGYRSLGLIALTGFITGLVFTKQSRPSLAEFGAASWLPSLVAIAVIRALAPLVTAIICAGKVGSSIGAELGSMKVTEQIDAMEVSAVNPFKFLVVSRVLATTFMIPMLMMFTAFVSLMGSFLDVHLQEQTSLSTFIHNAFQKISFLDFYSSLARSLVFGFTIGMVGAYKGYHTTGGTQGVGRSANSAVVMSMFLIFIEEIIIVQLVNSIRG